MSASSTINFWGDVFMLKIDHPICCGIDVHNPYAVAIIGTTKSGVTKYKTAILIFSENLYHL